MSGHQISNILKEYAADEEEALVLGLLIFGILFVNNRNILVLFASFMTLSR